MTYKEALTAAMDELATDPLVRFVGYGTRYGRAMGTLNNVRHEQLVETPVAENLMVGLAIGMALRGLRPVVYIERFDFILNAMDAIVNHLDKIGPLSNGVFKPAVILRVVAGNKDKPLFTGATHTQDFSEPIRRMVSFPVYRMLYTPNVQGLYRTAHEDLAAGRSTMLVEMKDLI